MAVTPDSAIRAMQPDENDRVRQLFGDVYTDTFGTEAPDFEEATAGEAVYLYLLDGEIAGFISVWEPDAFIHFLFVGRECRRHGIGGELIRFAAEKYGGTLTLKCLKRNKNALEFYRQGGWRFIGEGCSEDGEYAVLALDAASIWQRHQSAEV